MSLPITKVVLTTAAPILLFLVPTRLGLVVKSKAVREGPLGEVILTKSSRRVSIESSKVRSGYYCNGYYMY